MSARLLSIEREAYVRTAIFCLFAFHFDRIKKKERKKDSKIFDLYIDRRRERGRESVQCLSFFLLLFRPLEK